jgi:hypothetical protein
MELAVPGVGLAKDNLVASGASEVAAKCLQKFRRDVACLISELDIGVHTDVCGEVWQEHKYPEGGAFVKPRNETIIRCELKGDYVEREPGDHRCFSPFKQPFLIHPRTLSVS